MVLLNNPGFGGVAHGNRLVLPMGITWSTVAHELGHALGGLGDEYHVNNQAYTGPEPTYPNLTAVAVLQGLKWAGFVAAATPIPTGNGGYTAGPKPPAWDDNQSVGLFEGGDENFSTGIYRPVLNCRMNTNNPAYCPVCANAMQAKVQPFLV
jgi:hypothetical protein